MRLQVAIIALSLTVPAFAGPKTVAAKPDSLTGNWTCGPTKMVGPDLTVTFASILKRSADHTFAETSTIVLTRPGKPAETKVESTTGTWQIDGKILIKTYLTAKFISSTDPTITPAQGQKNEDDQQRRNAVYRYKILEIGPNRTRTVPAEAPEGAAPVESCKRTA